VDNNAKFSACIVFSGILWFSITGCAVFQKQSHMYIMRGHIIDIVDKNIVICIGSKDGAQGRRG